METNSYHTHLYFGASYCHLQEAHLHMKQLGEGGGGGNDHYSPICMLNVDRYRFSLFEVYIFVASTVISLLFHKSQIPCNTLHLS